MSTAFCKSFSNTAAAVAVVTERKIITSPIMTPPAISSVPRTTIEIYASAAIMKMARMVQQYFIMRRVFTAACENTLLSPMKTSSLNARNNATKNGIDAIYA